MSASASTLIVYVVGLSSTEAAVFAAVSRILRLQNIQIKVSEKPDNSCQLIIIHVDSERGKAIFDKLKSQEIRQHVLLLGDKKPDLSEAKMAPSFLQKPLRVQELLECLENLNKKFNHQSNPSSTPKPSAATSQTSDKKPVPVTQTKVAESPTADSQNTFNSMELLSILLSARQEGAFYQITNKYHSNFWVNGAKQEVLSSHGAEELFKLIGDHHASGYIISSLSFENFKVLTENKISVKLNDALWYAALADKRGELVAELDENTPVKLTSWPNMTRLSFDPSHIRIAAVLSRQAETLNDLVSKNKLSRLDTVCFLNAAYSIHLLEKQDKTTTSVDVKVTDTKKSGLLHKIANHLNIKL